MASIGFAAYAGSLLWASSHSSSTLSKDHFLQVELSGASAEGSIKPGGSVNLEPVVENKGDVNAGVFIRVSMPTIPGTNNPAYEFEPGSDWNLVKSSDDGGVQVWSYGSKDQLESVGPGSSTDPLCSDAGFIMKSEISGLQFRNLDSVDIGFDGYLVEYSEIDGDDPETAWSRIPGN